ncbi:MAG: DUF6242 domain-containing protein [Bacteroidaceae bacterium]
MKIKQFAAFVCFALLGFTVVSCLNSDTKETDYSQFAVVTSFSLDSTRLGGLTPIFTIDQKNHLIFNVDSLPNSVTDSLKKILMTMTYNGYLATVDDLFLDLTDSLDLSSTMETPFLFQAYSPGLDIKKTYSLTVNIHQQVPDSLHWVKMTDSFSGGSVSSPIEGVELNSILHVYTAEGVHYSSADAQTWNRTSLEGWPVDAVISSIRSFNNTLYLIDKVGTLYSSIDGITWNIKTVDYPVLQILVALPNQLSLIVDMSGVKTFATLDTSSVLTIGDVVEDGFPTENINGQSFQNKTKQDKAIIIGEADASDEYLTPWFTYTGLSWAISENRVTSLQLPIINKPSIINTDDSFMVFGQTLDSIYSSKESLTWTKATKLIVFPEEMNSTQTYALIRGENNFYYIIHPAVNGQSDRVYRGRVNKYGF